MVQTLRSTLCNAEMAFWMGPISGSGTTPSGPSRSPKMRTKPRAFRTIDLHLHRPGGRVYKRGFHFFISAQVVFQGLI
jgi:hypothetical protein